MVVAESRVTARNAAVDVVSVAPVIRRERGRGRHPLLLPVREKEEEEEDVLGLERSHRGRSYPATRARARLKG